jgi:hypothetical protein
VTVAPGGCVGGAGVKSLHSNADLIVKQPPAGKDVNVELRNSRFKKPLQGNW